MIGPPNRASVEDFFTSSPSDEPLSVGARRAGNASSLSRYVLPKHLDAAIKQLNDQELDRLILAALEERTRRRKAPGPEESIRTGDADPVGGSLPQGKLNAVRAAFKAGVTPARIARVFGLSQSDVRSALAANSPKR